jgi:hypothetical protein
LLDNPDEGELKNAMLSLKNDISNVPYTDESVNRFLAEIIYGGMGKKDVLKEYEKFTQPGQAGTKKVKKLDRI